MISYEYVNGNSTTSRISKILYNMDLAKKVEFSDLEIRRAINRFKRNYKTIKRKKTRNRFFNLLIK